MERFREMRNDGGKWEDGHAGWLLPIHDATVVHTDDIKASTIQKRRSPLPGRHQLLFISGDPLECGTRNRNQIGIGRHRHIKWTNRRKPKSIWEMSTNEMKVLVWRYKSSWPRSHSAVATTTEKETFLWFRFQKETITLLPTPQLRFNNAPTIEWLDILGSGGLQWMRNIGMDSTWNREAKSSPAIPLALC